MYPCVSQPTPGEVDATIGSAVVLKIDVLLIPFQSFFTIVLERAVLRLIDFHGSRVGRGLLDFKFIANNMARPGHATFDWGKSVAALVLPIVDTIVHMPYPGATDGIAFPVKQWCSRCGNINC